MGAGAGCFATRRRTKSDLSAASADEGAARSDGAQTVFTAFPPGFAAEVASLAQETGLFAAGDEGQNAMIEESCDLLKDMEVVEDAVCDQLKHMGLSAGGLAAAELLAGGDGSEEKQGLWEASSKAQPCNVDAKLWKRTKQLFQAGSRWACAEKAGDEDLATKERRAFYRHSRALRGFGPGKAPKDRAAFAQRAAEIMPATIVMFSGCKDNQTSADCSNTSRFRLPSDAGPGGAGGACTNSFVKALYKNPDATWVELLTSMRKILRGRYSQIPQLSSSKEVDLNSSFRAVHAEPSGRYKALLVGINYVGTRSELNGCHNDVETMRRYLTKQGYPESEDCMRLLMDDDEHQMPTRANIKAGLKWLAADANVGDSLFFHYSGHGGSCRDDDSDEEDGRDEYICPSDRKDRKNGGLIRDDKIFQWLVAPLKEGVQLTCVMDCCHSGTILDLPYSFKADDAAVEASEHGDIMSMLPNQSFDFGKVLQVLKDHPFLAAGSEAAISHAQTLLCMGSDLRDGAMNLVDDPGKYLSKLRPRVEVSGDKLLSLARHYGASNQLVGMARGFFG